MNEAHKYFLMSISIQRQSHWQFSLVAKKKSAGSEMVALFSTACDVKA